ncbi:MAG: sigma 54-interacting transcriptional regulator [Eubacteriaceae bacterium]|nr:sigma 54-interacting transcriptional regulator [Eubacteriaceae bacterium]
MKKVIIFFNNPDNESAMTFIRQNIKEVFEDYIDLSYCYLSEISEDAVLDADAFLVSPNDAMQEVKNHVSDFSKVIKITRSPDKEGLNKLSSIPSGTTVLIVNDSYETSLATTQSFYEVGIGHINLVPFDQSLLHTGLYDNIEIAVTPAESHLVPAHIKKIIDIGYRKVSFETMFKLMKLLKLDVPAVNRNLFRHVYSVVEPNAEFNTNYINGYLKSEMINRVIDTVKMGLILVNKYFDVIFVNDKALSIFNVTDQDSLKLTDYISADILSSNDLSNENIEIGGEWYRYDKYTLTLLNETAGYYITLQNMSDVSASDKHLAEKGFVAKHSFKDIVHQSKEMDEVIQRARQIAQTDHTVLIRGESGTGKELFAQSIHNASSRSKYPFIAINCAALPESLLESELFGYEKGAFTGAHSKGKIGLFEEANHGTIFLDEIGDISPNLQSRLLRTIQERQIMRVGSDRIIDIDIRLITATNRDLEAAIQSGDFRADLYFRLNVLPIEIPPLRKRKKDLSGLFLHFLGKDSNSFTKEERQCLMEYDWPGNVREVENAAIYYKTLSQLPPHILSKQYDGISGKHAANLEKVILQIIEANTSMSHGIGRTFLLQKLNNKGISLSDVKLRSLLSELEKNDYIDIGKGRYGTRITESGSQRIQEL